MIAHIVLKDLRRLWPFVAGLAVLQFALAAVQVALGFFPDDHRALAQAANILGGVGMLLIFFIGVLVVQLDPVPDDRQDWLVRPIRRRDLLAAKLLFVILAVHLPLFAANLAQGLADGFPLGQAISAAACWSVYQFAGLTLPALAAAALTRTVGQTLGLVLAIAAFLVALIVVPNLANTIVLFLPRNASSSLVAWLLRYALLLTGVATILGLQYFRRRTIQARVALAVFIVLIAASQLLLPADTALALQNWMQPAPTVTLAFAPEAGRQIAPPRWIFESRSVRLALPLKAVGLPPGMILVSEGAKVVITAPDGRSTSSDLEMGDGVIQAPGVGTYYQLAQVQQAFLRAHAGQKVRVDIRYTLATLRLRAMQLLAADGGDAWLAQGAHCASRILPDEGRLQVGCLQAGNVHQRAVASLTDAAGGPPRWNTRHLPSDAPYSNGADMITRFSLGFLLGDLKSPQQPTVAVTLAEPVMHMMRDISIPDVRLEDWTVENGRDGVTR